MIDFVIILVLLLHFHISSHHSGPSLDSFGTWPRSENVQLINFVTHIKDN